MALEFPPIYLLKSHFERDANELHRLEKEIGVVWDIKEAKLVLGRVKSTRRAAHELRKLGLHTEEVQKPEKDAGQPEVRASSSKKRRKIDRISVDGKEVIALNSDTESELGTNISNDDQRTRKSSANLSSSSATSSSPVQRLASSPTSRREPREHTIKVLNLAWYTDSIREGKLLPIDNYLVYEGTIPSTPTIPPVKPKPTILPASITSRRQADSPSSWRHSSHASRKFGSPSSHRSNQPAQLLHQTTSEYEESSDVPPIPEYLHTPYSCQRPTPLHCPNEDFLSQLRVIKKGRILKGDEIGVRAYSAAVATIASYPYTLTSSSELSRLPNCGPKIAKIWQEWKDLGHVTEVNELESDPDMKILNIFYDIHDVGDTTARKFLKNGWKDLDDIVEHGWNTLSKSQQIGVKFYDEFLKRIPRDEVERIANVVLDHANKITDGFQMVICGGYRRGKPDAGDVDVVLSHPDEEATERFLGDLLESLEADEHITHRLIVSMKNSNRGQTTVSWKGSMPRSGSGFDTLDHAFVVWQDPDWPSREEDLERNPEAKNPNPHRRVDIIISPWKTAGCAVVGWSGGTMFERDLRNYCRKKLGMKFDSSGVRKLDGGEWVDLEEGYGDLLVKEKRVFSGLGLEWREPTERCTD